MKEIEVSLTPTPGAKAEFLATVKPDGPTPDAVLKIWDTLLERRFTLEAYTRDAWAWKPSPVLLDCSVVSTDGRQKLPGFLDYLKNRNKCCFGRFGSKGVVVVSYVQDAPKIHMKLRLCSDCTQIKGCPLQPRVKKAAPNGKTPSEPSTKTTSKPTRKAGGLLGKLVAAQKRTNENVAKSLAKPVAAVPKQEVKLRTSQQVFQEFREQCQKTMLDFDLAEGEPMIKVPIVLKDHTSGLPESEAAQVTMELLKYMVFEAAEEVNEEWIPYKEPSEFMDEAVIAIYKEGEAPPEVLEEINKGDLPDEVRGQQKAIHDERMKQAAQAEARNKSNVELRAHREIDDDDDLETLNVNKRDRRTIEDFERERQSNIKRNKIE